MQDVSVGSHVGCQCRFTCRMSVYVHMQDVSVDSHAGCQCRFTCRMSM